MWKTFKEEFPEYGDNVLIVTTDGKHLYIMYEDHRRLWFSSGTNLNYSDDIIEKLTHWCFLTDLGYLTCLPGQEKSDNIKLLEKALSNTHIYKFTDKE